MRVITGMAVDLRSRSERYIPTCVTAHKMSVAEPATVTCEF